MDNQNEWLDIIMKLYPKLHLDPRVEKRSNNNDKKRKKITKWLDKIEEVHDKVAEKHDQHLEQLYKAMYYQHYIIKEEDIPDNYYNNQKRMARERGFGDIELTPELKHNLALEVINNQKETLDKWIEYFLYDEESKSYPMWEKFWVFQGLQKLGKYNKETGKFSKRKKVTTYPFPPVDREAIFTTIHLMEEFLKDKTAPEEIREALYVGNFKQLYEFSLRQMLKRGERVTTSNEGIWIKYNQGSNYKLLRNSLQDYYTGWCTAAGENFARSQLRKGDFYVYYSKDTNGEYKIPRIAIRMNGSHEIGEIRGIAKNQNLEPEMMPILEKKLEEFPDRNKYYKKENDMKILTQIDYKTNNNIALSGEEISFLYEINSRIEGFGYEKDPRIEEIKHKRNRKEDMNIIKEHEAKRLAALYNVNYKEIGIGKYESYDSSKHKIWIGDLNFSNNEFPEGIVLPKIVKGNVFLNNLETVKNLTLPEEIEGSLYMTNLKNSKGLVLPKKITGLIDLRRIKNVKGLVFPEEVESLNLNSLKTPEGLVLPRIIKRKLDLSGLETAKGLILPENLECSLLLTNLKNPEGLILPKIIKGSLDLYNLKTTENLVFPEEIKGSLYLSNLEVVNQLELPKIIGKELYLSNLIKINNNLVFPKKVGGDMILQWFIPREEQQIVLPEEIGGDLNIDSMQFNSNIVLPKKIKGKIKSNGEYYYKTYFKKEAAKAKREAKKSDLDRLLDKLIADMDNIQTYSRGR